jgi:hypothetical protein
MLPPSDPMAARRARREDELARCVEVLHTAGYLRSRS